MSMTRPRYSMQPGAPCAVGRPHSSIGAAGVSSSLVGGAGHHHTFTHHLGMPLPPLPPGGGAGATSAVAEDHHGALQHQQPLAGSAPGSSLASPSFLPAGSPASTYATAYNLALDHEFQAACSGGTTTDHGYPSAYDLDGLPHDPLQEQMQSYQTSASGSQLFGDLAMASATSSGSELQQDPAPSSLHAFYGYNGSAACTSGAGAASAAQGLLSSSGTSAGGGSGGHGHQGGLSSHLGASLAGLGYHSAAEAGAGVHHHHLSQQLEQVDHPMLASDMLYASGTTTSSALMDSYLLSSPTSEHHHLTSAAAGAVGGGTTSTTAASIGGTTTSAAAGALSAAAYNPYQVSSGQHASHHLAAAMHAHQTHAAESLVGATASASAITPAAALTAEHHQAQQAAQARAAATAAATAARQHAEHYAALHAAHQARAAHAAMLAEHYGNTASTTASPGMDLLADMNPLMDDLGVASSSAMLPGVGARGGTTGAAAVTDGGLPLGSSAALPPASTPHLGASIGAQPTSTGAVAGGEHLMETPDAVGVRTSHLLAVQDVVPKNPEPAESTHTSTCALAGGEPAQLDTAKTAAGADADGRVAVAASAGMVVTGTTSTDPTNKEKGSSEESAEPDVSLASTSGDCSKIQAPPGLHVATTSTGPASSATTSADSSPGGVNSAVTPPDPVPLTSTTAPVAPGSVMAAASAPPSTSATASAAVAKTAPAATATAVAKTASAGGALRDQRVNQTTHGTIGSGARSSAGGAGVGYHMNKYNHGSSHTSHSATAAYHSYNSYYNSRNAAAAAAQYPQYHPDNVANIHDAGPFHHIPGGKHAGNPYQGAYAYNQSSGYGAGAAAYGGHGYGYGAVAGLGGAAGGGGAAAAIGGGRFNAARLGVAATSGVPGGAAAHQQHNSNSEHLRLAEQHMQAARAQYRMHAQAQQQQQQAAMVSHQTAYNAAKQLSEADLEKLILSKRPAARLGLIDPAAYGGAVGGAGPGSVGIGSTYGRGASAHGQGQRSFAVGGGVPGGRQQHYGGQHVRGAAGQHAQERGASSFQQHLPQGATGGVVRSAGVDRIKTTVPPSRDRRPTSTTPRVAPCGATGITSTTTPPKNTNAPPAPAPPNAATAVNKMTRCLQLSAAAKEMLQENAPADEQGARGIEGPPAVEGVVEDGQQEQEQLDVLEDTSAAEAEVVAGEREEDGLSADAIAGRQNKQPGSAGVGVDSSEEDIMRANNRPEPVHNAKMKLYGMDMTTSTAACDEDFQVLLEELREESTTVMICNIPSLLQQSDVLEIISEKGFKGKYDFFYLPIDFATKANCGFAFINFMATEDFERFMDVFQNLGLHDKSRKRTKCVAADLQGFEKNVEYHRNSASNRDSIPPEFRPLIWDSNGLPSCLPPPSKKLRPIFLKSWKKPHSGNPSKQHHHQHHGHQQNMMATQPQGGHLMHMQHQQMQMQQLRQQHHHMQHLLLQQQFAGRPY